MFSLSNGLSLLRAPLALFFLSHSMFFRLAAILLAMFTDALDGYLARRRRSTTQLGAILDPAMDKFFVFIALSVLLYEHQFEPWQAMAMVTRDGFLCIFGIYLKLSGKWTAYQFRSIRWGKATTALQFIFLIGLTMKLAIPPFAYGIFIIFGLLAFVELFQLVKKQTSNKTS
ncbi:MAG: CDP-diacylglycerol--glycerol-3-phosphate 3-phosphatidyltransferase [Chlamydiae bacterium]|nr:CDP-diacylglycerol--glycerol-3-phosphate 3-phosphatidyltransferase [Chlamydiota bacterium]